eukprot:sb/3464131/
MDSKTIQSSPQKGRKDDTLNTQPPNNDMGVKDADNNRDNQDNHGNHGNQDNLGNHGNHDNQDNQGNHGKDDKETGNMDSRDKMKKNITVLRGISIVVGTIIGNGIFITPNSITRSVGAPATSLLVWLAGGAIAAVGGMTFCELGCMFPVSGAEVTYLRKIYGPVYGFLAVWLLHFVITGMCRAIGVLSFSAYFWSLFYSGDQGVNWFLDKGVCLLILLLIAALTAFKPTLLLKVIVLFTASKIVAMGIIIVCGVIWLAKGQTEHIAVGFNNTNHDVWSWNWNGVIWSYLGWEHIFIVTSEVQNPQRNVPIIAISSVAIVTILCMLTVASYHVVLPLSTIIQEIPIASEFGTVTMGTAGRIILALIVVFSSLGTIICTFLTESRYIHAGAAEGLLPGPLELVSRQFKTPLVSVIYLTLNCAVFVLMIAHIGDLPGGHAKLSRGKFIFPVNRPDLIGVPVNRGPTVYNSPVNYYLGIEDTSHALARGYFVTKLLPM